MARVWKVAPGEGAEDWDLFRERGCIGLGWLVDSDYRDFRSEVEVLAALEESHGDDVPGHGAGAAKVIRRFVHEVKLHHIVVANDRYNGVVGVGVVASEYLPPKSAQNPIREDTTTHRHHARRVNWLITDPIDLPGKRFFAQSTLWTPTLHEGAVRKITVNAYEWNPVARQKCVAAHGTTCRICGFSFGARYGPKVEGYTHVRHVRPLSEVGKEYAVDPLKDLRPVCPNCRAVLHLGGECRSIEEVRQILTEQRQAEPGGVSSSGDS